jgi:tRNA(Ile)-lysidine synthase
LKRVQNTNALLRLWSSEKRFVIAVSGGPDSLCLLDVFLLLSRKYRFDLHVAHVNYRLRGIASDRDETLVRERSALYGLPCTVFHPNKPVRGNLEEMLREQRYAFFERLRKRLGYDLVAVAHNEDDQAETLLLRLLRGSGLRGLSAMRARNERIIRPLLATSREDILHYLAERGLSYREDESNTDRQFLRNRIRHELIPLLERDFQPQAKKVLARTAATLAEEFALLENTSPATLQVEYLSNAALFSRAEAVALPAAILVRELRELFRVFSPGKSPEKGSIDEWVKALRSEKKKSQLVKARGLKLERKGDRVTLLKSDR